MRGLIAFLSLAEHRQSTQDTDKEKGEARTMADKMGMQDRLSKVIDRLKEEDGDHFDSVAELEEIWGVMDQGYTTGEVAALVEEIKAKTYDGVKARVLSLLEALLQAKGMGTEPAGRVLDILLRDVDRQITDIAAKHVPEITPDLIEEKRNERLRDTDYRARMGIEEQIRLLREEADSLEHQAGRRREDQLRNLVYANLRNATSTDLASLVEHMNGGRPVKTAPLDPR